MLNKKIHNQPMAQPKPPVVPPSFGHKTKIQGVDPGMVTMASGVCSDQKMLFASINRYEALQGSQDNVRHGKDEDVPFKMTAKIVNAAVNTKTLATNLPKKKQKKCVQSKCRLRRFYGKRCSQHRRQMGSKSFITFAGNWHGASTYIKGHNRRSTKPYYGRLAAHGQDQVTTTNEFASTVTCNSCFCRTKKRSQRLSNGKMATIKGAVICVNPRCPRRLTCKATTINRDENGARNIALIGFSTMVSRDGCTLPPFRPSYNPDKYTLSPKFRAYQIGDATNPSQGGDQFRVPRGF
ncbi:hypothetical protein MBANPS3_007681 [Mucor bainieri]